MKLWNENEKSTLRLLCNSSKRATWSAKSDHFDRTKEALKQQFKRLKHTVPRKMRIIWTRAENNRLFEVCKDDGKKKNWVTIAAHVDSKTKEACKSKWNNRKKKSLNIFSEEEEEHFRIFGWRACATKFPNHCERTWRRKGSQLI